MATIESLRERVVGTNIDSRSLLSTDYFNHFNEVVMMLSMAGDMPEILDDIDKWEFKSYCDHFLESGLGFAPLAVECYGASPPELRERFDKIIDEIRMLIGETRTKLRQILEEGELEKFKHMANLHSMELQGMIDDGAAIVHGYTVALDQSKIDDMFP